MPKSRKNRARGRLAVQSRMANQVIQDTECRLCQVAPITSDHGKLYKIGRAFPCLHASFHWDCLHTSVLTSQVLWDAPEHRCPQCVVAMHSIERVGRDRSGTLSKPREVIQLPLDISPERMRIYRARPSRSWGRVGDLSVLTSQDLEKQAVAIQVSRAETRSLRELYAKSHVMGEEMLFRAEVLAEITAGGMVAELAQKQSVERLAAILQHAASRQPGARMTQAARPSKPLDVLHVQPTDSKCHLNGVPGLDAAGYPAVSRFCGSAYPADKRTEAVSYLKCRLVMEGAAKEWVAPTYGLRPPNWVGDDIVD